MEKLTHKYFLRLSILILILLLWNCAPVRADQPDYWPTLGWRTASPESQGMDSAFLSNMLEVIRESEIKIDSVLVVRNGYIVLDAYGWPRDPDAPHNLYSCSKSVTSALIGIAIDKGDIDGVNQPALNFFPRYVAQHLDADKKANGKQNGEQVNAEPLPVAKHTSSFLWGRPIPAGERCRAR